MRGLTGKPSSEELQAQQKAHQRVLAKFQFLMGETPIQQVRGFEDWAELYYEEIPAKILQALAVNAPELRDMDFSGMDAVQAQTILTKSIGHRAIAHKVCIEDGADRHAARESEMAGKEEAGKPKSPKKKEKDSAPKKLPEDTPLQPDDTRLYASLSYLVQYEKRLDSEIARLEREGVLNSRNASVDAFEKWLRAPITTQGGVPYAKVDAAEVPMDFWTSLTAKHKQKIEGFSDLSPLQKRVALLNVVMPGLAEAEPTPRPTNTILLNRSVMDKRMKEVPITEAGESTPELRASAARETGRA